MIDEFFFIKTLFILKVDSQYSLKLRRRLLGTNGIITKNHALKYLRSILQVFRKKNLECKKATRTDNYCFEVAFFGFF